MMYFSSMFLCALLTNSINAQTPDTPDARTPRVLTDRTMSQRLQQDLSARNSLTTSQSVMWYESQDGYYGTYSNKNQNYMSRYDKNGSYMETLVKKEWNDAVPAGLFSSFNQSEYNTQKVTSFWEVTDSADREYYLELTDDQGKTTRIWADENGNFSTSPNRINPRNN